MGRTTSKVRKKKTDEHSKGSREQLRAELTVEIPGIIIQWQQEDTKEGSRGKGQATPTSDPVAFTKSMGVQPAQQSRECLVKNNF